MKFNLIPFFILGYNNLSANAFSLSPQTPNYSSISSSLKQTSVSSQETDVFFEAIECAKNGLCDIEKMDGLAAKLEGVDECKFEEGEEACDKEIQDRLDIAGILRLRIELKLRVKYLKSGDNLFESDVNEEHLLDERKKFKAALKENRDKASAGSDLGLW
eukprot:CAMPEP_0194142284 /NCGR_PEP_ID=MMETSP0152-20130528/11590_1 /TAXON_ID=1049557 /ORGANISM="Thalassiothrix antarctica, Strain L6-D1" /LENGTH=159 /DNA_ID=CAMNT_0038841199 /DNA_START=154 /DNA_END=630 /DNA_ORIENTATION=+